MFKRVFVLNFLFLVAASPIWCQTKNVVKGASQAIRPRIKGADIPAHFTPNTPAAHWGNTYLLNEKFQRQLQQEVENNIRQYQQGNASLGGRPIVHPHSLRGRILNPYPGDWTLQRTQLELADQFSRERIIWLKQQPQEGRDRLATHTGEDSARMLAVKLQNENLIFVGEYHDVTGIRSAAADWLITLHQLEPKRTMVVFAESLYLDPLPQEDTYPYTYSRRGVEGVQPPVDIRKSATHPAYVSMQNYPSYDRFIKRLAGTEGIEVYPLEDAVIAQMQQTRQKLLTISGLKERNAMFARVMRAQMERIRAKDPQALFVFYGGNAHTSWAFPTSLPKMFADEFPVVVEMSSPAYALYSHSILGSFPWAWTDGFFDSSITAQRLFYWKGEPETARTWGRQIGFDYRLIVPD